MTGKILRGKPIADEILTELTGAVAEFQRQRGVTPKLAAVLVGDDPASDVYVRSKRRACEQIGMTSDLHRLPARTSEQELLEMVARLNQDATVHGILVQLPLPPHIDSARVLDAVHPLKDVDAFHPENVGLIAQGRPRFMPCTPHGIVQLLCRSDLSVDGQHVVIVGRSDIVGKPLALLLMQRDSPVGPGGANATVTVAHSRTRRLAELTRTADIIVAAVGRAHFITAEMVRPGAVVIDVGINRTDQGLAGDVHFESVLQVAGHVTPVPGGVGPLTVAMLLHNTLTACRLS